MAFLNESGLARLWENIIAKLNNKIETEVKVLDDKIETEVKVLDDKIETEVKVLDDKIETELDSKMDKVNPMGAGIFHMNSNEIAVKGEYSSTLGFNNEATDYAAHAEGAGTKAIGYAAHAEGAETVAQDTAHAEGVATRAQGQGSHAEGTETIATLPCDHAEGMHTTALGPVAHAEGMYTVAQGLAQHAQGKFNIVDTEQKYAHIVGNGENPEVLSNAHTLDWEGNAWYSGDVYVGSTSGINKDEGSKKLATEEFVNTALESAAVVQPDWEQNDSTADDYIKNRPFYTQNGRVALVDNLTRENYENGIHPTCNFVPGQSYDIVWDGVLYENIICIDDDGWNVILGDAFYIDDDGGNGLYIEGFEEDWSTLSIFTTQELIKKIDEKYLPNVRKVLKLYTCYSEDADDGRAAGTPALIPNDILRAGSAHWEDYVTVEALANADDIVIFEGQTKVGVPANITFCTRFSDYYNTSTEYAIITFYSEHEGKIRTMWSRESNLWEYLATQDYIDAEISKISAISLTENLTDPEKQQVRDNIGAGTSNFSGSYNDLTDKPDLGQQELITPEDIDTICGQSIELASEVLL